MHALYLLQNSSVYFTIHCVLFGCYSTSYWRRTDVGHRALPLLICTQVGGTAVCPCLSWGTRLGVRFDRELQWVTLSEDNGYQCLIFCVTVPFLCNFAINRFHWLLMECFVCSSLEEGPNDLAQLLHIQDKEGKMDECLLYLQMCKQMCKRLFLFPFFPPHSRTFVNWTNWIKLKTMSSQTTWWRTWRTSALWKKQLDDEP